MTALARITKTDLDKRQKALDGFLRKLDSEGRVSEKAIMTDLRSAIRSVWMRHPTKLSLLYKNTIVDDNPSTRTKWLFPCAICKGEFKGADVEVDHIFGENSLKSLDDLREFVEKILWVRWEDLRILCKPCHGYETYSERYGVTFEQAKKEKVVIEFKKLPAPQQRKWLVQNGIKKPSSNLEGRVEQIREVLREKGEI